MDYSLHTIAQRIVFNSRSIEESTKRAYEAAKRIEKDPQNKLKKFIFSDLSQIIIYPDEKKLDFDTMHSLKKRLALELIKYSGVDC